PEGKKPTGSPDASPPPASTTPIPLTAAFKPPPDTDKEKPLEVPQPAWQTVEKDWGKVKTDTAPESIDLWPGETPWTQLTVGQTAKKQVAETKTVVPVPVIKKEPKPEPAQVTAVKPKVTARPEPPPAKAAAKPVLTVAIINESGRPEVAEAYRDVFQARGYRVEKIENRTSKTGPTTIFYAQGFRDNALDLARGIPGQRTLAPMIDKSAQNFVIVVRSPL
ncbi:MAG: LytR C-terminal domain-containing protein, partial [Pseudomonadota bacterium]